MTEDRAKFTGTWTLASVTDHDGNVTDRGQRRAGAKVTLYGRPRIGVQYAADYVDEPGTLITTTVCEWERTESVGQPDQLVVTTKNSVYTFIKEAAQ